MKLPIEKQVCSLELAQKLKDLGVKQESHFAYWHIWEGSSTPNAGGEMLSNTRPYNSIFTCSAFTVAELGEMLKVESATEKGAMPVFYIDKWIHAEYAPYINESDTEADARAKMLIYLLENNFIGVEEVNK